MKKFIIILFHCLVNTLAEGQSDISTSITGTVFDKSTRQPLDYATVSVMHKESGKLITGSLTDSEGKFTIYNVPFGRYKIVVNYISYENVSIDNVTINIEKQSVSLGTIYLSPSVLSLAEVTVVSDKPVIENRIGKIIYNVSSDISSQGGLAIDVLKKVPQVTVDADGNVELQGNSNVRFLINGKSSSIFGNSLADALASIPASQIKSIEAITNPGARYDSQGTGGIINIILEDNKLQGISGNTNLSAGTRLQNGSVNLSAKKNNFGVNGYFSGNWRLSSKGGFTNTRVTTDSTAGQITTLTQDGFNNSDRLGLRSGLGFEWNISERNTLTGSVGYNQFSFSNSGQTDLEQWIRDLSGNNEQEIFTVRNSESSRNVRSIDWNLDYTKNFKKEGHELDVLFSSTHGRPVSGYTQTQLYTGETVPFEGSSSNNPGTDNQIELSLNYVYPINENFSIETGLKSVFQNLMSIADVSVFSPSFNDYISDPLQSYNLKYNLKIYAGYFSSDFRLFNFLDLKPGLRYEYTDVGIDFPNTSIPSYGTFVPSLVLSHSFNERNSLQLAYSKRIQRPDYGDLNPFVNRSDPYNITTGNVFLKPEIGNSFELSFNGGFKNGGNLRLSVMERITTQETEEVTTFYPEYSVGDSVYKNVLVTTEQNIGEEYATGLSVFASIPVTPKFNLRGNLMLFNRYLISNLNEGNVSTGINTRFNLNATYELPRDLALELFGFYRSGGKNLQGRSPQFFIYTFAFRKRFWDRNGSFGFTATNPFSRNIRMASKVTTENSESSTVRELPFRSFGIAFTWKFGNLESKKRNRENDNDSFNPDGGMMPGTSP